jgi:large subunit ribosomal protein L32
MAQPKKKTSNSKQWSRRSQWKAKVPNLTTCQHCKAKMLQHTICRSCGHYRGQQIIAVAAE